MKHTLVKNGSPIFIADTIDEFAAYAAGAQSRSSESTSWQGGMSLLSAIAAARNGHLPSVEASDAYLEKFDSLSFQARKFVTIDDVAGGAVNVGAFVSGTPMAMRRRQRVMHDAAPLTIFCDMVSSAGIDANDLKKRGAAVVALARMLSATRPVTVYAVGGMGAGGRFYSSAFGMVRVDFNDLSRAAFVLSHPAAQRGMMYTSINRQTDRHHGMWACGGVDAYRKQALGLYCEAVQANPEESLYLAPPYYGEDIISAPEKWIVDMLAKYGAAPQEE